MMDAEQLIGELLVIVDYTLQRATADQVITLQQNVQLYNAIFAQLCPRDPTRATWSARDAPSVAALHARAQQITVQALYRTDQRQRSTDDYDFAGATER